MPTFAEKFFEFSLDMLCTATPDNYFDQLSPSWEAVLGWSREELRAQPFLAFCHPDDVERTTREASMLAEGHKAIQFENRYRHKNGGYVWLSWMSIMREGTVYAVARDITEYKQQQLMLASANEELENFAYVASHDLKAPLRDIDNLAKWVIEDAPELPESAAKHLALMQDRISRMERLLTELLAYSRAGRVQTTSETYSTQAVFDAVRELVPTREGIDVVYPQVEALVVGQRAPLETILRNLISNAIKHHDRERGRVEISCDVGEATLTIAVKDDGPGIAKKYHKKVFGMFQTLQPKDKVEGTGIGLALTQKLAHAYGGAIRLESEEGRGCVFSFTWPRTWRTTAANKPNEDTGS